MLRVLIATDLSPEADRALSRALAIAAEHDASILIVHAPGEPVRDEDLASIRHRLKARCGQEAPPDLKIEIDFLPGDPVQAILAAADGFKPDLIAIGGHAHMRLRDAWLGTIATRLVRRTSAPTLVVRSPMNGPYRRVVVALDDSSEAEQVLRLASRLDSASKFYAVHALPISRESYVGHQASYEKIEADHRKALEQMVARIAPTVTSVEFHSMVEEGDVFPIISKAVRDVEADLLVLGTHQRRGLAKIFFGSVAEDALSYFELDILVVPTGYGEPHIGE